MTWTDKAREAKRNKRTRRKKIAMANALSMAVSAKRGSLYKDRPVGTYRGKHGVSLPRVSILGDAYYWNKQAELDEIDNQIRAKGGRNDTRK